MGKKSREKKEKEKSNDILLSLLLTVICYSPCDTKEKTNRIDNKDS